MRTAILAIALGLVLLFGCTGQTNTPVNNQPAGQGQTNTAVDAKSELINMLNDSYNRFSSMEEYTIVYSNNVLSTGEQKPDLKYYRRGADTLEDRGEPQFVLNGTFYDCSYSMSRCVRSDIPEANKKLYSYEGTILQISTIITPQGYNVSSVDKVVAGMDSRCFILNSTSWNGVYCFSKSDKIMTEAAIPNVHFVLKSFEQSAPGSIFILPFNVTNSN